MGLHMMWEAVITMTVLIWMALVMQEWAKNVMAGKLSKSDKLGTVDHSKIDYPPFRRNFYIEVQELQKMSEADVAKYRLELENIKVQSHFNFPLHAVLPLPSASQSAISSGPQFQVHLALNAQTNAGFAQVRGKDVPKPVKTWNQCGLSSRLLEVLRKSGFAKPMAIQAQALPAIMSGRDCIGIAKTGSGKTLAFVLPMLRHIKDQVHSCPKLFSQVFDLEKRVLY
jgi:ATP-dependent RNA helicase DDX46/PRP5